MSVTAALCSGSVARAATGDCASLAPPGTNSFSLLGGNAPKAPPLPLPPAKRHCKPLPLPTQTKPLPLPTQTKPLRLPTQTVKNDKVTPVLTDAYNPGATYVDWVEPLLVQSLLGFYRLEGGEGGVDGTLRLTKLTWRDVAGGDLHRGDSGRCRKAFEAGRKALLDAPFCVLEGNNGGCHRALRMTKGGDGKWFCVPCEAMVGCALHDLFRNEPWTEVVLENGKFRCAADLFPDPSTEARFSGVWACRVGANVQSPLVSYSSVDGTQKPGELFGQQQVYVGGVNWPTQISLRGVARLDDPEEQLRVLGDVIRPVRMKEANVWFAGCATVTVVVAGEPSDAQKERDEPGACATASIVRMGAQERAKVQCAPAFRYVDPDRKLLPCWNVVPELKRDRENFLRKILGEQGVKNYPDFFRDNGWRDPWWDWDGFRKFKTSAAGNCNGAPCLLMEPFDHRLDWDILATRGPATMDRNAIQRSIDDVAAQVGDWEASVLWAIFNNMEVLSSEHPNWMMGEAPVGVSGEWVNICVREMPDFIANPDPCNELSKVDRRFEWVLLSP